MREEKWETRREHVRDAATVTLVVVVVVVVVSARDHPFKPMPMQERGRLTQPMPVAVLRQGPVAVVVVTQRLSAAGSSRLVSR